MRLMGRFRDAWQAFNRREETRRRLPHVPIAELPLPPVPSPPPIPARNPNRLSRLNGTPAQDSSGDQQASPSPSDTPPDAPVENTTPQHSPPRYGLAPALPIVREGPYAARGSLNFNAGIVRSRSAPPPRPARSPVPSERPATPAPAHEDEVEVLEEAPPGYLEPPGPRVIERGPPFDELQNVPGSDQYPNLNSRPVDGQWMQTAPTFVKIIMNGILFSVPLQLLLQFPAWRFLSAAARPQRGWDLPNHNPHVFAVAMECMVTGEGFISTERALNLPLLLMAIHFCQLFDMVTVRDNLIRSVYRYISRRVMYHNPWAPDPTGARNHEYFLFRCEELYRAWCVLEMRPHLQAYLSLQDIYNLFVYTVPLDHWGAFNGNFEDTFLDSVDDTYLHLGVDPADDFLNLWQHWSFRSEPIRVPWLMRSAPYIVPQRAGPAPPEDADIAVDAPVAPVAAPVAAAAVHVPVSRADPIPSLPPTPRLRPAELDYMPDEIDGRPIHQIFWPPIGMNHVPVHEIRLHSETSSEEPSDIFDSE